MNAATSACGKGLQWQLALALVAEMTVVKVDKTLIICSAVIRACEGLQSQLALTLSEMAAAKADNTILQPYQCLGEGPPRALSLAFPVCSYPLRNATFDVMGDFHMVVGLESSSWGCFLDEALQ